MKVFSQLIALIFIFSFNVRSVVAEGTYEMFGYQSTHNIFAQEDKIPVLAKFKSEDKTATKKPEAIKANIKNNQKPKSPRDAILAEFGDPFSEHPVKAVKDAPKPFAAMIESIKAGDRELAFQYAGQYVRYIENLEKVNTQVVAIQGKAMQKHGVLPKNSWATASQFDEYNDLMNVEISKNIEGDTQGHITSEAKSLIQQAKSKNDLLYDDIKEKELNEKASRALARAEMTGKLPVSVSGKIDLFFFLKLGDQQSIEQAKAVEGLRAKYENDSKITIVGYVVNGADTENIKIFKSTTSAKFNIVGGVRLAESMNIKSTPQILLIDSDTNEFSLISKNVTSSYLDESLKIMRRQ